MENKSASSEYEKAIDYIYTLMQEGHLKVGSKLPTERAIAERLGIGRNSIREALCILHGMGLVERVQGSGNYVSKNIGSSIKQILTVTLALGTITRQDVCSFRRIMEKSVCMLLVDKDLSVQQVKHFEEIFYKMKNSVEDAMPELDKAFHDSLILATDNTLFITIMEAITEVYREWIDAALKKADVGQKHKLVEYHTGIFQSIMNKNTDEMLYFIDKHYDLTEEMLR